MMYYIDRPHTWKAKNRLWADIQTFVAQFENTLIADEISRDALIEEIRTKVEELNQAYPRMKKLKFDCRNLFVSCFNDVRAFDNDYVFTFHILPVRRTYRFSEKATASLLTEGGDK